jgi:hypothetical protein
MSASETARMLTADDISLTQTCYACPEQYDAYDPDGRLVGYLRLRHGWFTVDMPDASGTEVYSAQPAGDGLFAPDERDDYLRAARERIASYLNAAGGRPTVMAQAIAITTALEEAAIADYDADDGKVIEIYVSQIAAVVGRVLASSGNGEQG